ncbi:MAG TPA: TolC family protein [Pirellulales bacterium]|nr:TolC family protein [Pirellulales bacterium]
MKPFVRYLKTQFKYNVLVTALAWGALLVLPGCLPALRPPLPGPGSPQSFFLPQNFSGADATENSAMVPAREFFSDPRLLSLIDQALVRNLELKILAEQINIANNEIMRRRGAYLPFLSLGTTAQLNKYSYNTIEGADNLQNIPLNAPSFPTPLPDFLMATELSWQIDIWRQLRNARDAQGLRFLGTQDGRNYVVTRVVAEIADNYYMLMSLDNRLANLDYIIALQEQALNIARLRKQGARGNELAVQRFLAEVRKNQSQKLIIRQQIIEVENRINFLAGRYPQPVERASVGFLDLTLHPLAVGVPPQLIQNRPDIRQAERELGAAGLDVRVARANFYPRLMITGGIGYEAFNPKYMFLTPESLIYNVAGGLVAPFVNRMGIKADYMNANARQLQALYDYQRVILNAFTEVINRMYKVQNYSNSIEIKKQQLKALETSVSVAGNLFQNARVEYIDVLYALRDLVDARMVLIETKQEQLSAIVNAYQALGGGWRAAPPLPAPPAGEEVQVPVAPPEEALPAPAAGAEAPAAAPPAAAPGVPPAAAPPGN